MADESSHRSVRRLDPPAASSKDEDTLWWYQLFARPIRKNKQRIVTSADETTESKKKDQKRWTEFEKRQHVAPEEQSSEEQRPPTAHHNTVVEVKSLNEEEKTQPKQDKTFPQTDDVSTQQQIKCRGFPNPAQICYINSCLQSLLMLEDFVAAISRQEQLWSVNPGAALMRSFMDIKRFHLSTNARHKIFLLAGFKRAVSIWAPTFRDLCQKDAHEFLVSVLEQMRHLAPQLQVTAASAGRAYRCPVEDHLVFKMQITRTCKRCGAGSTRQEEFTNLDLIPGGGTVEQMLQNYLAEAELDYTCECGASTSSQCSSFITLPRVLVLHLKRFRFTPSVQLRKVHDPVVLCPDLVLSSSQGGGCLSLRSSISHIGSTARSGHYVCDGVDPDVGLQDPTDHWFTYNDAMVTETSATCVCDQRQREAYILFYRRHD